MSGPWPGGHGTLPATQMGFEHVNADTSILPGFELKLLHYDTQVCYIIYVDKMCIC